MATKLEVGQRWVSTDTGNIWEIMRIEKDKIHVLRCPGVDGVKIPEWDDGKYVWHASVITDTPHMELLPSPGTVVAWYESAHEEVHIGKVTSDPPSYFEYAGGKCVCVSVKFKNTKGEFIDQVAPQSLTWIGKN